MKYYLDTEFWEHRRDGRNAIDLISIALVAQNGQEFYVVNRNFDYSKLEECEADPFLRDRVLPNLTLHDAVPWEMPVREIADEISNFIGLEPPEFWGWYSAYDWVLFSWLYDRMVDLPSHFPKHCNDMRSFTTSARAKLAVPQPKTHNALHDARWVRDVHNALGFIRELPL